MLHSNKAVYIHVLFLYIIVIATSCCNILIRHDLFSSYQDFSCVHKIIVIFFVIYFQIIFDINVHIAVFRDLLIHVGTTKDAPELREKIRRVRMQCVEGCQQTNNQLLPQVKR